jgi:hypothetical protein
MWWPPVAASVPFVDWIGSRGGRSLEESEVEVGDKHENGREMVVCLPSEAGEVQP